jgi:hypothetical protein
MIIGAKVYNNVNGKNGVIERIKNEEDAYGHYLYYYVCHWCGESSPYYDWVEPKFLTEGHRIE